MLLTLGLQNFHAYFTTNENLKKSHFLDIKKLSKTQYYFFCDFEMFYDFLWIYNFLCFVIFVNFVNKLFMFCDFLWILWFFINLQFSLFCYFCEFLWILWIFVNFLGLNIAQLRRPISWAIWGLERCSRGLRKCTRDADFKNTLLFDVWPQEACENWQNIWVTWRFCPDPTSNDLVSSSSLPRRSDGFIICNFSVHILLVARVAELRGHLIRHFVLCIYVANLWYTSIRHCVTI